MLASTSNSASSSKDVSFVHFGASNHMTFHQELFLELQETYQPGYVETTSEDVSFVNSGATNHMTSHQEWFREL